MCGVCVGFCRGVSAVRLRKAPGRYQHYGILSPDYVSSGRRFRRMADYHYICMQQLLSKCSDLLRKDSLSLAVS